MDSMSEQMLAYMQDNNWIPKYKELVDEALRDEEVQAFIDENADRLNQESIMRSAANIYEFVQEKKKFQSQEEGLAPGFYPQLVINKHHIDVTYVPTDQKKQELAEKEVQDRVTSLYLPKDIAHASLSDVDTTLERQEVLNQVYQFIEDYLADPSAHHPGLYLYGPFGVGKTFVLGAMLNELAEQGAESVMVHFPSFSYAVKQSLSSNSTDEHIQPLRKAPILLIDDIGADSMSSWLRDDILGVILQHRMQEHLATFFTSNFSMDELENHLTYSQKGEREPLKAKRIMERIKFLSRPLDLKGTNRRHNL